METASPEIKEPKYSSMSIVKSKLPGLKNYEFDDSIVLMLRGRIIGVRETYDKKDTEYTVQPVDCEIVHKGKHKLMDEMDIDSERYKKIKDKKIV